MRNKHISLYYLILLGCLLFFAGCEKKELPEALSTVSQEPEKQTKDKETVTEPESVSHQETDEETIEASIKEPVKESTTELPTEEQSESMDPAKQPGKAYEGAVVASMAFSLIETPFKEGGCEASGLDEAGLIWYCYDKAGVGVSKNTDEQLLSGRRLCISDLSCGDIVVYEYEDGTVHTGLWFGDCFLIGTAYDTGVCLKKMLSEDKDYQNLRKIYGVRIGENSSAIERGTVKTVVIDGETYTYEKSKIELDEVIETLGFNEALWQKLHYQTAGYRLSDFPTLLSFQQYYVELFGHSYPSDELFRMELSQLSFFDDTGSPLHAYSISFPLTEENHFTPEYVGFGVDDQWWEREALAEKIRPDWGESQ